MDMRTPITIVRTFFGHTGAITGLDFNGGKQFSACKNPVLTGFV